MVGGWRSYRELGAMSSSRPSLGLADPPVAGIWPIDALAGLHAQLLPGGRLLRLGLGAGVGAAVERGHGAAFGVGVQAAVRRRVAGLKLRGALHFLQSTD